MFLGRSQHLSWHAVASARSRQLLARVLVVMVVAGTAPVDGRTAAGLTGRQSYSIAEQAAVQS